MSRKKRTKIALAVISGILIVGTGVWLMMRAFARIQVFEALPLSDVDCTDPANVMRAVSLCYFVYGCERCDSFAGTVSEMLSANEMGIIAENDGIVRSDPDDPETALIDTSEFILRFVGNFRCLCSKKDGKSGFFGAAFCDDSERCVWVVYAGAITFPDYLACAGLAAAPGLAAQEKAAFALFDTATHSDEVTDRGYRICLAGHSLGGALATEVSLASGLPAITVNGADGLAYQKISGISGEKTPNCRVHNYVTKPDGFSFMETVQRLTFLGADDGITTHLFEKNGYTNDTHCAFSFLRFADDDFSVPVLPAEAE